MDTRNYLPSVVTRTSCPTLHQNLNMICNIFKTHIIFEQLPRRGHGSLSLVGQEERPQDAFFAELIELRFPLFIKGEGADDQGGAGKVNLSRQITSLLGDASSAHARVGIIKVQIKGVEMFYQASKCPVIVKFL